MNGHSFKAPIAVLAFGLFVLLCHAAVPAFAQQSPDTSNSLKSSGFEDDKELRYFQLQPFNIPVIRDGKLAQILSIAVTIEVKGYANQAKVMDQQVRLRDAFLRDIYGVASVQRADGRAINPQVVKTRLMSIGERMFGPGIVENVLVHGMTDRNLR